MYIDRITPDDSPFGHPFAGYYLPYPEEKFEGLVSTITDEAPILNWVYVDSMTYEVKYGIRVDAQPNFHTPFDCTRQDHRMTFDGWEGFCAVEESPGVWALYFDYNDDGLRNRVLPGTRVLEVVLTRVEKRWAKDPEKRKAEQSTISNLREPDSEPGVLATGEADHDAGGSTSDASSPGVSDALVPEQTNSEDTALAEQSLTEQPLPEALLLGEIPLGSLGTMQENLESAMRPDSAQRGTEQVRKREVLVTDLPMR